MSEPADPTEPQSPSGPAIGQDEWVARHGERRSQRAGVLGTIEDRLRRAPWWAWLVLFVAAFALMPAVAHSTYVHRVAFDTVLFMLLALGLNVVVGWGGMLDLGFVAFYGIGAYSYAILASGFFGIHIGFLVVVLIGAGLAAFAGILLGLPVLKLRGDYLAIVTLGFGEIVRILLNNFGALTNGPQGITGIDRAVIFGFQIWTPLHFFYLLSGLSVAVIWVCHRLERSILGLAWRSVRADQDAAAGLGIDTVRVKLIAFAVSAGLAGATGVVFAAYQRFVSPESFQLWESIIVMMIIVIGGVGNIVGVIVGAAILIIVPEFFREYYNYRMLLDGLLLISLVILRPEGIVPRWLTIGYLLGDRGRPSERR
jgi:branched-chain amino acid transport system permease protein